MPAEGGMLSVSAPRRQDNNAEFPSPLLVTGTDGSGLFFPSIEDRKEGEGKHPPPLFQQSNITGPEFPELSSFPTIPV